VAESAGDDRGLSFSRAGVRAFGAPQGLVRKPSPRFVPRYGQHQFVTDRRQLPSSDTKSNESWLVPLAHRYCRAFRSARTIRNASLRGRSGADCSCRSVSDVIRQSRTAPATFSSTLRRRSGLRDLLRRLPTSPAITRKRTYNFGGLTVKYRGIHGVTRARRFARGWALIVIYESPT